MKKYLLKILFILFAANFYSVEAQNNNMGASNLDPLNICNYSQTLSATVKNFGSNTVDSFSVYYSINGVHSQIFKFTTVLTSGSETVVSLFDPSVLLVKNTLNRVKVWTHQPNGQVDPQANNDTFYYNISFVGFPDPSVNQSYTRCGNGRAQLSGYSPNGDSLFWYDQPVGGTFLGVGNNVMGPMIRGTKTFYAQTSSVVNQQNFFNNVLNGWWTGQPTTWVGAMCDVTVNSDMAFNSITHKYLLGLTGVISNVYYKRGTYLGAETDPSQWTLLFSGLAGTNGSTFSAGLVGINFPDILVASGETIAFAVFRDPSGAQDGFELDNVVRFNSDISIGVGTSVGGFFGNIGSTGFSPVINVGYKKVCSNTSRSPLTVTVIPKPIGADVVKGTPFDGQFNEGTIAKPDAVEPGKTVSWNLVPPTGYTNADHGNTWDIYEIEAKTRNGFILPATDYIATPPSASGPARLEFTGSNQYLDSFITFTVKFLDNGPNACDSSVSRTVVVVPVPIPDFTFNQPICLGQAAEFDNISTIHSGDNSYKWYFGDGDSSDFKSPSHIYSARGNYTVRLVATSSPWGIKREKSYLVTVQDLPVPNFTVNNVCVGNNVTFQNLSSVGNGSMNFSWDFGDGSSVLNTTSMMVPPKSYSTPGGYKVNLIVNAGGCITSITKDAFLFPKPVPMFQVPASSVCERTKIAFNDESTLSSGLKGTYWKFGNGDISTNPNELYAYNGVNTYQVTLISTSEFNCRDSIKKNVTTRTAPQPNFTTNTFCEHKATNFVNTTVETLINPVYTWTMSDGFSSNTKNVLNKKWSGIGPVSITLNARFTNLCEASLTKSFDVLSQPISDFSVNNICSGETAKFFNATTGDKSNIKYAWDFGNGGTDVIASPTRVYTNSSTMTYNVRMVAYYDGGCRDTLTKSLTVSASPICDFTIQNQGGLNNAFVPANTNYTKYEWFFGEGGYSTSVSPTYQYLNNGNFVVKLRATNAEGCTCESTKPISANTSVKTIQALNVISIYPNPSNGLFTISNSSQSAMKIEIFNVLGSKILTKHSDKGTVSVNLSDESKGIYLVKITSNGQTSIHKVTIAD